MGGGTSSTAGGGAPAQLSMLAEEEMGYGSRRRAADLPFLLQAGILPGARPHWRKVGRHNFISCAHLDSDGGLVFQILH